MTPAVCLDTTPETTVLRITEYDLKSDQFCRRTEEILEQVRCDGCTALVFDLGMVPILSTDALMRLIVLSRRLRTHGCRLCLAHVQPDVYAALLANRVTSLFDLNAAAL